MKRMHGGQKLLFLGSTCIYPKNAPQPMKEDCLLTSPLEYTNEEYAIAKIAGLKMCESYNLQYGTNYIAVMPTNLYGPNDNFHLENSHVMPAMMRKVYLAKLLVTSSVSRNIRLYIMAHPPMELLTAITPQVVEEPSRRSVKSATVTSTLVQVRNSPSVNCQNW